MIHQILSQIYPFYIALPDSEKERFQYRVQDFIKGRDFIGRSGLEIEPHHKVLVAAAAIQLTFGFERYMFPYFNTVVIHPNSWELANSKRYSRKQIHLQGALVFAWDEFMQALAEPSSFQFGIHELAHAFYFEKFMQNETYGSHTIELESVLNSVVIPLASNTPKIIVEYAQFHIQEQFAVATERYFAG